MVVVDGAGIPLGDHLYSASPPEVRLAEATLATICVGRRHRPGRPRQKPARVIADRGYDSDRLHKQLARPGIELIVPHRKNRRKPPTQDGRALRRYKRRWTVERTIAWLGNFRRLVVRYDRSLTIYQAFFHIACFMITARSHHVALRHPQTMKIRTRSVYDRPSLRRTKAGNPWSGEPATESGLDIAPNPK
jgi:transposase